MRIKNDTKDAFDKYFIYFVFIALFWLVVCLLTRCCCKLQANDSTMKFLASQSPEMEAFLGLSNYDKYANIALIIGIIPLAILIPIFIIHFVIKNLIKKQDLIDKADEALTKEHKSTTQEDLENKYS